MADIFVLFDWVGALLLAGALAMVALTHKEMRVARLLLICGSVLTVVRWAMWSFVTDTGWPLRAIVGGVLGAMLLSTVPAFWHWTRDRESALKPIASGSVSLPIDITYRQKSWSEGRPTGSIVKPGEDSWYLYMGPVVITNTSKTEKVILDITLHTKGKNGWDMKVVCSNIGPGGKQFGEEQKIDQSLEDAGFHYAPFFRCPISIEPQKSVTGRFVFIEDLPEDILNLYLKAQENPTDFANTLIITDKISAKSIEIPIIENYHGN
jgi:hypothetical protein